MSDIKSVVADIQSAFDKNGYPEEFLAQYDQMECLASHHGRETFLVREKDGGGLFVAKCYDKSSYSLAPNDEVLKGLSHEGLPTFSARFENSAMLTVVRDYVEGTPLDAYAAERELSRAEIVSLCSKLSDILIYLHGRTPPVIHRDIKPENVIVRPDGGVSLIDFDIARVYKGGAGSDTVFFGTKGYAPPEQYGFAQTDCRTDIYSFGVLLRYLLTGSVRENQNVSVAAELQRIIDKCTAFSPKDRYDSMSEVKKALKGAANGKRSASSRRAGVLCIAALVCLGLGFGLGRVTAPAPDIASPAVAEPAPDSTHAPEDATPAAEAVSSEKSVFSEPLIETAVRVRLGLAEDVALTADDLAQVREIFIYGDQVFSDLDGYNWDADYTGPVGDIGTLEDLALLPNLTALHIGHQTNLDISAIAAAPWLETVEFKNEPVKSLAPLGELERLMTVVLMNVDANGISVLGNCPRLYFLKLERTHIGSLTQLGEQPYLQHLELGDEPLDDLKGIERFANLRILDLRGATVGDMSALLGLPKLETVYANEENFDALTRLFEGSGVEVVLN